MDKKNPQTHMRTRENALDHFHILGKNDLKKCLHLKYSFFFFPLLDIIRERHISDFSKTEKSIRA